MKEKTINLPELWMTKKLGDLCDILDKKRKPISKQYRISGKYPYYGATGIVDYVNDYIFSEKLILVGEDGAKWGRGEQTAFAVDGKYWVNNHAHVLKPDRNIIIDSWIIYYFNHLDLSDFITGVTVPKLNQNKLVSIKIPVPPIEEQKRIVEILDKAFEGIAQAEANTRRNLINARELFDSYLNNIFRERGDEWTDKNLKDIAIEFGRGKSKHRPRNDKKLYGGNYPFVQTGDIRNSDHIVTNYSQTYNDTGLAQSKLWKKGTVCITIAANIAETAVLDFDACIPDSVIGLLVDDQKANNMFVEYMLQSFKLMLQSKGKGSAQDNINMGTFKDLVFPFPPDLEIQQDIVEKLDFLSSAKQKLETIYQRKLEAIAELKQSILEKAFTGQLSQ